MPSDDFSCNYDNLILSTDKCNFALKYCGDTGTYFNLISFHYCQLNDNIYISMLIFLLMMLVCFYILSDTSNKYVSTSLTIISDKLGFSPNISALTLLALGNGAPDVISSIVASDDADGLYMGLGSLLGSGMVLTTLVFSLVILFSKEEIKVIPKMFIRECVFYLISLIVLGIFGIDNKITLWEAILFMFIYVLNVIAAKIIEIYFHKSKVIDKEDKGVSDNLTDDSLKLRNDEKDVQNESFAEEVAEIITEHKRSYIENDSVAKDVTLKTLNTDGINLHQRNKIKKRPGIFYRIKRHYFNIVEDYQKLPLYRKIIYLVFELPLNIFRDISIPTLEENKFHRVTFILHPIFALLITITFVQLWEILIANYLVAIGVFIIAISFTIILFILFKNSTEPPKTILPFCFINFVISIIWIWAASNLIVDTINFLGIIFGINTSFLGLTLLAIGNSVQDAGLNCSLSKNGYGEMAIAGSLAGPLFNLLIGLSLSLIQITIKQGDIKFNFFSIDNLSNLIAYIGIIANLVFLLIISFITKYKLGKINAYISLVLFVVYIMLLTIFTFIIN